MSKGTWQGSGTWQSSGPDLGDIFPAIAVAVIVTVVIEVVLSVIVWIAVGLGVVIALAVAGLIWRVRGNSRRQAVFDARYRAAFDRHREGSAATGRASAAAIPRAQQPAIEQHTHYHFHGDAAEAALQAMQDRQIAESQRERRPMYPSTEA